MNQTKLKCWYEDLDQLAIELPQRHKNLFFQLKSKVFYNEIENLKHGLQDYDDYEIILRIARIVAMVKDAHTTLALPLTRLLPLEFYWFPDGIYITGVLPQYKEVLFYKVTEINQIPMDEVIKRLSSVISYENPSFLKSLLPRYLGSAEILYGLENIDDFKSVNLTLQKRDGDFITQSFPFFDYNDVNKELIKQLQGSFSDLPLYRRNPHLHFWSIYLEKDHTLYFNYNRCRDMDSATVEKFTEELMEFIHSTEISRLVIDLRNNLGGNSQLLDPFIRKIRDCKKLNRTGKIFVIIGRETFSSALLNAYSLKNKTKAILIGEPSGGKPNCYGEVQYLELLHSGLKIRYSTEYYRLIKSDKVLSLFPDVSLEVTVTDQLENRDPCMEYILSS